MEICYILLSVLCRLCSLPRQRGAENGMFVAWPSKAAVDKSARMYRVKSHAILLHMVWTLIISD
jgi:hypothetical protein